MSHSVTPQRSKAEALLGTGRLLRMRDLAAAGVAPETVARMVRDGSAVRQARGLYQIAEAAVDARHTLAEAAAIVPKGVICLTSALQFHGLTLQLPSSVWMAIERTSWKPKISCPPIRFVRFNSEAMTFGLERHAIEGVTVSVTTPARTIIDCFRYRNKIGLDIAIEGLRDGLKQRRVTIDDLHRHAVASRAWSVMRPYVEAIAADGP